MRLRKVVRIVEPVVFSQPGDTEMLAEAFDGVFCRGVVDTNGENRVDDGEGKVVVARPRIE
jgi:hypothetical protein